MSLYVSSVSTWFYFVGVNVSVGFTSSFHFFPPLVLLSFSSPPHPPAPPCRSYPVTCWVLLDVWGPQVFGFVPFSRYVIHRQRNQQHPFRCAVPIQWRPVDPHARRTPTDAEGRRRHVVCPVVLCREKPRGGCGCVVVSYRVNVSGFIFCSVAGYHTYTYICRYSISHLGSHFIGWSVRGLEISDLLSG